VGSGQSVTALYEMEMKPDARGTIATVRVRYRRTDTGKVEEIDRPVTGADLKAAFDQADARFRLAACVAELAEKLRGSSHAAGSEFTDIAAALEPVALDLRLDPRVQELLGLVRSASSLSIAAE
jgi:Ca-activated chloride channel family protein